ncbi:MAG TPA: Rieske (2Fe-2S) protein [Actinomycetota bacterium]|jgi:nitrite reductase/ring-hydroxylating ferredoxin subunit
MNVASGQGDLTVVADEPAARPPLVRIAAVTDVPPGWVLKVRVGSREIALANSGGTFTAMDNACTHAGGPLGDNRLHEGCYLECPWHNAVFDARTGDVVRGPARKAARLYPVTVQDGTVFVALA